MPAKTATPAPAAKASLPLASEVWTITTIAAYVAAAAMLLIGVLTITGVTLPSAVSADVQAWAGILMSLAGLVTPLLVLMSKNKVVSAAVSAGHPLAEARKLG